MKVFVNVFVYILAAAATVWAADAEKGRAVLENQGCLHCHTVRFEGAGHEAPKPAGDLGGRLAERYTATSLAAAVWNHTPAMWADLAANRIAPPRVSEADWQDMFAYLYSLQIFEPPAELRRGRQTLIDKRCTQCHALPNSTATAAQSAAPVMNWQVTDPVEFLYSLWNHAPRMAERKAANQRDWQTLAGRDLIDITAYVQNAQNAVPNRRFNLPEPSAGKALFDRNCANCHRGTMAPASRLKNATWADIGAGMWNHAPKKRVVPLVSPGDMGAILAYVWEQQYLGEPGNAARGKNTFDRLRCSTCHADGSPRPGQTFTPFSMVALGWGEGRRMHEAMTQRGVRWPRLSATDVANLTAYLNSARR